MARFFIALLVGLVVFSIVNLLMSSPEAPIPPVPGGPLFKLPLPGPKLPYQNPNDWKQGVPA